MACRAWELGTGPVSRLGEATLLASECVSFGAIVMRNERKILERTIDIGSALLRDGVARPRIPATRCAIPARLRALSALRRAEIAIAVPPQ
jgi:hypothetical protein